MGSKNARENSRDIFFVEKNEPFGGFSTFEAIFQDFLPFFAIFFSKKCNLEWGYCSQNCNYSFVNVNPPFY